MGGFRAFTLAGIPVHFTLWYFLILLWWMQGGVQTGLIWGGAITVSILVHEFGHALVAKGFQLSPWVELHGWGGLCHHERAARDRDDALIIIAGPGAGLAFGILIWIGSMFIDAVWLQEHRMVSYAVDSLLYVNIIWSFVNLVPLWPLDGGQLFRLGLLKVTRPSQAERITHIVGTVMGLAACGLAYAYWGGGFMLIIAAFLTYQNVQRIGASSASGPIRAQNRHAREVMSEAYKAYEARDWVEASRLAHQAKAELTDDPNAVEQVFEILGVSAAAQGNFREAWSFLKRLPPKGTVFLAKVECVLDLRMGAEAERLVGQPDFDKLPEDVRRDLQALAAG